MSATTGRRPAPASAASTSSPAPEAVDLWRLSLDQPAGRLAQLRESCNEEEIARAARFRRVHDAERFVAGRGQLRRVLGGYLGLDPSAVVFAYGSFGKPSLADWQLRRMLDFNLAHSDGLALLAVTGGARVGVDIEYPRPGFGGMEIARRFFAPGERRRLITLPEAQQEPAFLRCWTRKEAYVKAHGAGLYIELDSFEVPLCATPRRLLWSRSPHELERWSLIDVSDAVAGYYASLAVEGQCVVVDERACEGCDGGD